MNFTTRSELSVGRELTPRALDRARARGTAQAEAKGRTHVVGGRDLAYLRAALQAPTVEAFMKVI